MEKIDFKKLASAVENKFNELVSNEDNVMMRVHIDTHKLWDTYLDSYPEGTNEIFRERREHDCNRCKNFIRKIGNVVAINAKDNSITSVWDVHVPGYYQTVVDTLSKVVKSCDFGNYYFTSEKIAGSVSNIDNINPAIKWNHFFVEVPNKFVVKSKDIGPLLGNMNNHYSVLKRSLNELSLDSAETIMELIDSNSLYRGQEHKHTIKTFIDLKKMYDSLPEKDNSREIFLWVNAYTLKEKARIRNTVIGTLLEDITNDVEINIAVASFESKVAPTNYKRSSAVVTPKMIKAAQDKIREIGFDQSIERRMANESDIDIKKVLFSSVKQTALNVFDQMSDEAVAKAKNFKKVETVSLDKFINDILPNSNKLEILFENRMKSNLMTMVAPVHATASNMLKWNNQLSWSYNGDVTDSIKERVKSVGGNVEGEFRISLAWYNPDDLDLSLRMPDNNHISYCNLKNKGGELDIDMNAYGKSDPNYPVENIFWNKIKEMPKGNYSIVVNNFNKRSTERIGFEVSIDIKGDIHTYSHDNNNVKLLEILKFNYDGEKITIDEKSCKIKNEGSYQEKVWSIDTNTFVPVKMLMNSPNHWDDKIGNKHIFFILEGCKNNDSVRGFYNEYLKSELNEHRKVLEILGSKTKADPTDDQLSGLGFSETKNDEFTVRVSGKTNRVLKVQI